jgi:hypothetical protein
MRYFSGRFHRRCCPCAVQVVNGFIEPIPGSGCCRCASFVFQQPPPFNMPPPPPPPPQCNSNPAVCGCNTVVIQGCRSDDCQQALVSRPLNCCPCPIVVAGSGNGAGATGGTTGTTGGTAFASARSQPLLPLAAHHRGQIVREHRPTGGGGLFRVAEA